MSDQSTTRIIERIAGLEEFKDCHDRFADERQNTIIERFNRLDGRIMWLVGILILFISGSYAWTNICKAENRNYMEKNNDIFTAKMEKIQDESRELTQIVKLYIKKYSK